ILDGNGHVVRRYASTDTVEQPKDTGQIPWYWIRPPHVLSGAPGMHRFVWDLHYTPAPGVRPSYPIAAVAYNTAPSPTSPWVMPGTYTVRLTANGKTVSRPLVVKMDPRVKTPVEGLRKQFDLSMQMYNGIIAATRAAEQLRGAKPNITGTQLEPKGASLLGEPASEFGAPARAAGQPETLNGIIASLRSVMSLLQQSDVTPPAQVVAAAANRKAALDELMQRWNAFKSEAKIGDSQ
ncbi:MAG TPA: glycoside hydrolase, partial [Thermoanaerobaculia bacterium]|nr:glycoside hydrolase [Thermoanaerobaculia bacterium]